METDLARGRLEMRKLQSNKCKPEDENGALIISVMVKLLLTLTQGVH